jgi:hypothetical protein
MHFGENQLSRSLIGLSPLTTGHPPGFQPWWVRASTTSYSRFTLPMARSLRFGSRTRYSTPLSDSLSLRLPHNRLTSQHAANSQAHSSKGTQSRPRMKTHTATLPRLVGTRFQVLFHSAPAVLFTIPSRYYPLSVTREYLGLTGGPARFTQDFSGPMLLGKPSNELMTFQLRGSYPLRRAFHIPFAYTTNFSLTDRPAERSRRLPQPRIRNPCRVSHTYGLASSSFARHYSRNHSCFLFLRVLRCFTSPRSLHTPYTFRCR